MVVINEWLPNPTGKDSEGEWVELFNTSYESVDLAGWSLKANAVKKFLLYGKIEPRGYLVFKKPNLKLLLNNSEGRLMLFDGSDRMVDEGGFVGQAPEEKSFARNPAFLFTSTPESAQKGVSADRVSASWEWAFTEPTLGGVNNFKEIWLLDNKYDYGAPLNAQLSSLDFTALVFGAAVVLTGVIVYVFKKDENLSNLFFGRDKKAWK